MIRVQSVTHAYPGTTTLVLDDVCLELPRGRVTALVGPNGAGKSTLLAAASRLLTPASGQVLVDDLDIATAPAREVATRLAVLRQESRIGSRLSVVDLVRFGRFPHSQGRLTAADHEVVERYLREVELSTLRIASSTSCPGDSGSVPSSPWCWRRRPTSFSWTSP